MSSAVNADTVTAVPVADAVADAAMDTTDVTADAPPAPAPAADVEVPEWPPVSVNVVRERVKDHPDLCNSFNEALTRVVRYTISVKKAFENKFKDAAFTTAYGDENAAKPLVRSCMMVYHLIVLVGGNLDKDWATSEFMDDVMRNIVCMRKGKEPAKDIEDPLTGDSIMDVLGVGVTFDTVYEFVFHSGSADARDADTKRRHNEKRSRDAKRREAAEAAEAAGVASTTEAAGADGGVSSEAAADAVDAAVTEAHTSPPKRRKHYDTTAAADDDDDEDEDVVDKVVGILYDALSVAMLAHDRGNVARVAGMMKAVIVESMSFDK